MPPAAQEWINNLQLQPHPEGGYYREVSRGNWIVGNPNGEHRYAYTTIYFLLTEQSPSHLHRIQADEVWFHHGGDPIDIHCIFRTPEDELRCNGNFLLPKQDPSQLPLHTEYMPQSVPSPPSSFSSDSDEKEEEQRGQVEKMDNVLHNGSASPHRDSQHANNNNHNRKSGFYEIYKCITVGYRNEGTLSSASAPPTILQFTVPRLAIFGCSLSRYINPVSLKNGGDSGEDNATASSFSCPTGQQKKYPLHGYTLVSCVVAPGFDFKDFEVFTQAELLSICPQHEKVIRQLAYETLPPSTSRT